MSTNQLHLKIYISVQNCPTIYVYFKCAKKKQHYIVYKSAFKLDP